MASATASPSPVPRSPNMFIRNWKRISPSLVPVLAVLTALIATIPFMVVTGAKGDFGRGLNLAFTAYASFIEGSTGLAINQTLTTHDITLAQQLLESDPLNMAELRRFSSSVSNLATIGADNVLSYAETIRKYENQLDGAQMDALGERILKIQEIGADTLRAMKPLVDDMNANLSSSDAINLARGYATEGAITETQRAEIEAKIPAAAQYSDGDLLAYFNVISAQNGIFNVKSYQDQLAVLDTLGLTVADTDTQNFEGIFKAKTQTKTGKDMILELEAAENRLKAASITDEALLAQQINLVNSLYSAKILTNPDVVTALKTELQPYLDANFVAYRPGNQPLLIDPGKTGSSGIIYKDPNTPTDPSDDKPDTVYLRLGNSAFLFFPGNLERMLTRSIPFIIAGLALALSFKAGLFNIGAEGQLYAGSLLAVWVGFSPIFDGLPGVLRILLVLSVGIISGALWGMIPGILKAFTGAHEVINTIMLNFIMVRFVDWILRSNNPLILRDPNASTPTTPVVAQTARLPRFDDVAVFWFFIAGLVVFAWMLWQRREQLQKNITLVIRPAIYAVLVVIGGLFLRWINVEDRLHLGLVLMIGAVFFVDWFLNRTTPGFEILTVGQNQDAARYAGMNVRWNIILGLTLSGALAGLTGAIEISSVQFSMQPAFFSGLGFDAIAVALLARSNP
ncbi:MAG TPA: ABC transporter permease, partial [Phototrophicaceae bacterium]|nr:ABC transporter permease [Phototrophicaceae bacterium]